jgi:MYXO-CTERM domain-containing protein
LGLASVNAVPPKTRLWEVAVNHLRRFIRYGAVVAGVYLVAPPVAGMAQTRVDEGTTRDRDDGFDDWGLLGLLGLAGLLGRKRPDRDRVETRRV